MRPMYECFACARGIRADFNLLPHFDLRSKDIKLEPAKSAMVIVAEGVERELMGKIKGLRKNEWRMGTGSQFRERQPAERKS